MTLRLHHTLIRMAVIKKTKPKKRWQECREKSFFYTFGGIVSWCSHMKISMEVPQTKDRPYDAVSRSAGGIFCSILKRQLHVHAD